MRAVLSRAVFSPLAALLDSQGRALLGEGERFLSPPGEPALTDPDSVSWRIFKNPVALFIGGVAAVLLELAEPRVRAGVWRHSTFREDPVGRLRRTGQAAMMTVYGARSRAEAMIAGVTRRHAAVAGTDEQGRDYDALDPDLLTWVHATASYGFLEAYHVYVAPLSAQDRDRYYAEGLASAALYGAAGVPDSALAATRLLDAMRPRLGPAPEQREFLAIMQAAKALPAPASLTQGLMIRAAVDILPGGIAETLEISGEGLRTPLDRLFVRRLGRRADRLVLANAPPALACRRLGLPADYLYRRR